MGKDEIIDTLKDGVTLAGRMAARGVGEVSKALKPAEKPRGSGGETWLYSQRHLHPLFGSLVPVIEYLEYQQPRRFLVNMFKSLAIPAAERSFVTGCQDILKGNFTDARERMVESFSKDAQFADAYFVHGAICLEAGEFDPAIQSFKKVLLCQAKLQARLKKYIPSLRLSLCLTENSSFSVYPDLLGVSVLLSIAYRGNRTAQEAQQVLEQLLGVMPDHPLVAFFLALYHIEAGRWGEVVNLLKDTLPDDNLSLSNLILLGKACVSTGDPDTAVEIFRKISSRNEFDPQLMMDVRYNLGTALALQGHPAEAEQEFTRVTSQYPGYLDILERLGVIPGDRKRALPSRGGIPVVTDVPASPPRERQQGAPPTPPRDEAPAPAPPASPAPPAEPARPVPGALTAPAPPPPETEEPGPTRPARTGLHVVSADGKIDVALVSSTVVIGREEGDIVIDWDGAASHRHARIVPEDGGWWVEDMGSTNGTYVNGHRIGGRVLLNRGDVLVVGQTRFRLE